MTINLEKIISQITTNEGRAFFVGGCVRDEVMGLPSGKDIDIEVHGLTEEVLLDVVALHSEKEPFSGGVAFGVIKAVIDGQEIDFSLPREETKTGGGHKGFDVFVDPDLGLENATLRRDFTINALMKSTSGEIVDFHNGSDAIKEGKLIAVSDKFAEDPLRVLRGMKFAARFNMEMGDHRTATMCKKLLEEFDTLPKSRVWNEFKDFLVRGKSASKGLQFLVDSGWITKFPFLDNMRGCVQDPVWHPEGDAFVHTGLVMDEMIALCEQHKVDEDTRITWMLAAMLHDIGKPSTTSLSADGRITSAKHDSVGANMVEDALELMGAPKKFVDPVTKLVKFHMVHADKVTKQFVRRMSVKLAPATIKDLAVLMQADISGRHPLPKRGHPFGVKMMEVAEELSLQVAPVKKIVNGRDLLAIGEEAGVSLGHKLTWLFEAQLNGDFDTVETGVEFFQKNWKDKG